MAHFVIGWLRNTSYYLFGSGSSGLGTNSVSTDYTTSYFDYTVRVDATDGPKSVVLLANSNIPAGKFQVIKKGSSGKSVGTFLDVTTVLEPA